MSRIDDLIQELCPDGVPEWRLGDVAAYSKTKVDASDLDAETFVGVDNLVADKKGRVDAAYPPNTSRLTAFRPGDILLGNIRPYLKKVWLSDRAGGCSGDVLALRLKVGDLKKLIPKFLYYVISSDKFFAFNMKHAKGAKMPRGSKPEILNYPVPLPPLEIQDEIVRILDTFSALTAELEAELEARRTQYEHYRRELLLEGGSYELVSLGMVARIKTGAPVSKKAIDARPGPYPVINSGRDPLGFIDQFNTVDDPIGVTSRGAGVGSITWCPGAYFRGNLNYSVTVLDPNRVDVRYLYHALVDAQPAIQRLCTFQGIPALNKGNLEKLPLCIPSFDRQEDIAAQLDKFHVLVSDLTVGLPAEIEARRKQYEYYRDRLLSFDEAAT